jgi:hypothetical protein
MQAPHRRSSRGVGIIRAMEARRYAGFVAARESFKADVELWTRENPGLRAALEALREELGYSDYSVETPIVYNSLIDSFRPESTVRCILVADNPGKNEQKASNRSYLVGQSGKLAAAFFRNGLGIDFRTEVLVLNKTPVHTPKTAELKHLSGYSRLIEDSQRAMAALAFRFHALLGCPLWIVGYSELGGLFAPFSKALRVAYSTASPRLKDSVLVFRHFSMNQFSYDLKRSSLPDLGVEENLRRIGSAYRKKYLGF